MDINTIINSTQFYLPNNAYKIVWTKNSDIDNYYIKTNVPSSIINNILTHYTLNFFYKNGTSYGPLSQNFTVSI